MVACVMHLVLSSVCQETAKSSHLRSDSPRHIRQITTVLQGPLLAAALLVACTVLVFKRLSSQVYLLDLSVYRPADEYQVTWKRFMAGSVDCKVGFAGSTPTHVTPSAAACPALHKAASTKLTRGS